jgi:hypothetical protein
MEVMETWPDTPEKQAALAAARAALKGELAFEHYLRLPCVPVKVS